MSRFELKRVHLPNGIHLDVIDEGPVDAPVLIFLHGFPESHRTWRHQIAHFSGRYRCIAPDQRGYRGSSAPHPAIFQKLLYTNPVQRAASQYIRGFRNSANDALVKEHGLTGLLLKEVKWDRPSAMEPEEREALLRDWQNRDAAFGMLNYYRASPIDVPAMDAPFAVPEGYTPPALPKLTIPTLVIWALDDLALPPENLEGLEEIVDPLTIVKVPDCGHFVPWEAPQAVNAAMEDFLKA
jgi:pimeloyl-ACP methyl ester carboxylesterase